MKSFYAFLKTLTIVAFFLANSMTVPVLAEIPIGVHRKFENYHADLKNKHITAEQYFHKIDSFTYSLNVQGIRIEKDEFIKYLEPFRDMAWKSNKYASYRAVYYKILRGRAQMSGKGGEALFFSEKMDAEIIKNGGVVSISDTYQRCYFHIMNGNQEKAIQVYEEGMKKIMHSISLISEKKLSLSDAYEILRLNALMTGALIDHKDTFKVQRAILISESVADKFRPYIQDDRYAQLHMDVMVRSLYKDQAFFLNDLARSEKESLEIHSGQKGTELIVSIPIQ